MGLKCEALVNGQPPSLEKGDFVRAWDELPHAVEFQFYGIHLSYQVGPARRSN